LNFGCSRAWIGCFAWWIKNKKTWYGKTYLIRFDKPLKGCFSKQAVRVGDDVLFGNSFLKVGVNGRLLRSIFGEFLVPPSFQNFWELRFEVVLCAPSVVGGLTSKRN
jgi:hypothetical protein